MLAETIVYICHSFGQFETLQKEGEPLVPGGASWKDIYNVILNCHQQVVIIKIIIILSSSCGDIFIMLFSTAIKLLKSRPPGHRHDQTQNHYHYHDNHAFHDHHERYNVIPGCYQATERQCN